MRSALGCFLVLFYLVQLNCRRGKAKWSRIGLHKNTWMETREWARRQKHGLDRERFSSMITVAVENLLVCFSGSHLSVQRDNSVKTWHLKLQSNMIFHGQLHWLQVKYGGQSQQLKNNILVIGLCGSRNLLKQLFTWAAYFGDVCWRSELKKL